MGDIGRRILIGGGVLLCVLALGIGIIGEEISSFYAVKFHSDGMNYCSGLGTILAHGSMHKHKMVIGEGPIDWIAIDKNGKTSFIFGKVEYAHPFCEKTWKMGLVEGHNGPLLCVGWALLETDTDFQDALVRHQRSIDEMDRASRGIPIV